VTPDLDALVAFLRARLDELERLARAAGAHGDASWRVQGDAVISDGGPVFLGPWESLDEDYAAHAVAHDPTQVLREVDAHRRIVDACVPHVIRADDCGRLARGALFALALPHSSHPNYRESWRP
jgi:hypothetical protein